MFVSFYGGLGNQMFQLAIGKILSLSNNIPLIIDDSYYHFQPKKDTPQKLELDQFNINFDRYSTVNEKKYLHIMRIINKIKWLKKINNLSSSIIKTDIIINDGDISTSYRIPNNSILIGYFQSEKYLLNHREYILDLFTPREDIYNIIKNTECYNFINNNSNTTSVHIRRGDYISNPAANSHHGVCEISYYEKAINKIKLQNPNTKFIFFSDDNEWIQNNFGHIKNSYFVDNKATSFSVVDIYLMSLCSNNIIANSSFSWWGAWLNRNESKIVLYPKKWTTRGGIGDLLVDGWIGL
ncbi:alpha-1,2-fucosyltransferase [Morganella morganii]|nr:alpha-1,2-fucosyltransferase [Morganella morganii]